MNSSTTRTRFAVPDIRCDRCKQAIEGAVAPLEGVDRVEADVKGWLVVVDHDPARAEASVITAAIEREGYTVVEYEEVS